MGSLENIIDLMDSYSKGFKNSFHFYLIEFNNLIELQQNVVIDKEELDKLSEVNQNSIKAYGFFLETSNTTMAGVLRLLSGNLYSDAFSLIRILYEILCLMRFGIINEENRIKIINTYFKSEQDVLKQNSAENGLINLAKKAVDNLYPELKEMKYYLNYYGSHISKAKIGLGSVKILTEVQSSPIFSCNFFNKNFLSTLDMLFQVYLFIFEEYLVLFQMHMKIDKRIIDYFNEIKSKFPEKIRPQLLAMIKDK